MPYCTYCHNVNKRIVIKRSVSRESIFATDVQVHVLLPSSRCKYLLVIDCMKSCSSTLKPLYHTDELSSLTRMCFKKYRQHIYTFLLSIMYIVQHGQPSWLMEINEKSRLDVSVYHFLGIRSQSPALNPLWTQLGRILPLVSCKTAGLRVTGFFVTKREELP